MTLRRFWAFLELPFLAVGDEWKSPRQRKVPSQGEIEARVLAQVREEERASETPSDQMLREIEEASAKKFRGRCEGRSP